MHRGSKAKKASKAKQSRASKQTSRQSKYSKANQASLVANCAPTAAYDSPRILVVRKEGRKGGRILKSSLNLFKIEYVIVEHLYFGKFSLDL